VGELVEERARGFDGGGFLGLGKNDFTLWY
jgi:hypothetical protein